MLEARNEEKENFYREIIIGILKNNSGWVVKSKKSPVMDLQIFCLNLRILM